MLESEEITKFTEDSGTALRNDGFREKPPGGGLLRWMTTVVILGAGMVGAFSNDKIKNESQSKQDYQTVATITHVISGFGWETYITTINTDIDSQFFLYIGTDQNGEALDAREYEIPGRGLLRKSLTELLPDAYPSAVRNLVIRAPQGLFETNHLPWSEFNYRFLGNDQESMSGVSRNFAACSLDDPHITVMGDWASSFSVGNISDREVKLVLGFRSGAKEKALDYLMLLKTALAPGAKFAREFQNILPFQDVTNVTFLSYAGDAQLLDEHDEPVTDEMTAVPGARMTGDKVDAITGNGIYGMYAYAGTPTWGMHEGFLFRGEKTTGENTYTQEAWVPVNSLGEAARRNAAFTLDTLTYTGIAANNMGGEEATVTLTQYDEEGEQVAKAITTIFAGQRWARLVATIDDVVEGAFNPSVPGQIFMESTEDLSIVYLTADMVDADGKTSLSSGGDAPDTMSKSKQLRTSVYNNNIRDTLCQVTNTSEEEVIVALTANNENGTAVGGGGPYLIPSKGTLSLLASEVKPNFSGTFEFNVIEGDGAILGTKHEITLDPEKRYTNASGATMGGVNVAGATADIYQVFLRGKEVGEENIISNTQTPSIIAWANTPTGTLGLDRAEFFLDGEFKFAYDMEGIGGGSALWVPEENFAEGDHTVRIEAHLTDGNIHTDKTYEFPVHVIDGMAEALFTYYQQGQETDTLKVNEPYEIHYKIRSLMSSDITEVVFVNSPGDGWTPDDKIVSGLSGNYIEGVLDVPEGVGIGQSDVHGLDTIEVQPYVEVRHESSPNVDTDADKTYFVPPERVYGNGDFYDDYLTITQNNTEPLAEITSREGVLYYGTTQLSYQDALTVWTNIANYQTFSGLTINDFQNRVYAHFSDREDAWFDLNGQTFDGEQAIDDFVFTYVNETK